MSTIVSLSREVATSADEVFELLARPGRHRLIDGSGAIQGAQADGPERLSLGAEFRMRMRAGTRYTTSNVVTEFEEGRRIAWHHGGGWTWRWILQPVDDTHTVVTEQFDPAGTRFPILLRIINAPKRNLQNIERTLDRLEAWASASPR